MRRMVLAGLLVASWGVSAFSQDAKDKVELRYAFPKGERVTFALTLKMHVKLDEVPEAYQGLTPEEPFDQDFTGEADFEVKDVTAAGVAVLEGKFQKIKAQGSFLGQDFDLSYDRSKDGDTPKGGSPDDDDSGGPGLANPEEFLRKLATATIKLEIDPLGKIKVGGGGSGMDMASQLFDLGGLTGQLPKDKVGPGDSWKNNDSLTLPGLPFKMRVQGENAFEKVEKVDRHDCAFIQSKFVVGTEKNEDGDDEEMPLAIKPEFEGEGKGRLQFALDAGRPLKNEMSLEVKMTLTLPDPQGGEDTQMKGQFKMEQSIGVRRREE
ncbi:MAG: hypothetical protein HYY16_14530 [Planctomycetes bacterium]|nr:hypothetical protein [Planctomycetota bacterium]